MFESLSLCCSDDNGLLAEVIFSQACWKVLCYPTFAQSTYTSDRLCVVDGS